MMLLNLLMLAWAVAADPVLDRTNAYRAAHGAPAAYREAALDAVAERRAQALARKGELSHDASLRYGENLAMFWGGDGRRAVDMWYSEAKAYDFAKPAFSPETGHFTQLVWRSTCRVGYAGATGPSGATYFVMLYDPPGNLRGAFTANVFPNGTAVAGNCAAAPPQPKAAPEPKVPPQPKAPRIKNDERSTKQTRLVSAALAVAATYFTCKLAEGNV